MQSGLIVLMRSLQPTTTDLYLPKLPPLTAGFDASTEWLSWRLALLAVTIFGAVCLAVVDLSSRETVSHKNLAALQPATAVCTWGLILKHLTALAFSLLSAASYGGLFALLAASSFVLIQVLGLSTPMYGVVVGTTSLFYILDPFLCRCWLPRLGVLRHAIHQPCNQSGTLGPFPQSAGVVSAMTGFFMTMAALAMGGWLRTHLDGTVYPMVLGIWFWSVLIALTAWTLVQRYGAIDGH